MLGVQTALHCAQRRFGSSVVCSGKAIQYFTTVGTVDGVRLHEVLLGGQQRAGLELPPQLKKIGGRAKQ